MLYSLSTGHFHFYQHSGFLNFLHFIGWWCPGDWDASPIQILSKSVDALWAYSDFTIFQYDYSSPFGPQNYGPHFTHTSALSYGPQILVRILPVDGPQVRILPVAPRLREVAWTLT